MPEYDTTEISGDPADYISGPTTDTNNRTQGGTTRDGGVQRVAVAGDEGGNNKK